MWHNLGQLVRYRGLIQSLVARELKARYRGSVLGFFWSFVNPLLLLSVYSFVFVVVLPGLHSQDIEPYSLFMFCGLLPWTWFSSSLLESTNSLIAGGNLIKKVLFPAEVLPIVSVLANMVHFLLGLPILAAFMVYFGRYPDAPGLGWFAVVVLVQLIFTLGLGLLLSALTVHYRDLKELLGNVLTLWFFSTPILYSMIEVTKPGQGGVGLTKRVLDLNPMTHVVVTYQEILFHHGPVGHAKWLLWTGAGAILVFVAGYWVFDRLRDSFAEAV
jgi:ABC-type polysaccharide/polyol phosphate export permease